MDVQSTQLSRRQALAFGALAALSATLLSACSDGVHGTGSHGGSQDTFAPAAGPQKPVDVTNAQAKDYIDAQMGFALALLTQTGAATPDGNVIISPFSVAEVLSMIGQGAAGTTYDQIAAAMGVDGPAAVLAKGSNATVGALADLDKTTLSTANALFRSTDFAVNEAFDQSLVDNFGTPSYPSDFGKPKPVVAKINGWVAQQTKDKITDLLTADQVSADTRMVLVNACYLLAKWKDPFNPDQTAPSTFHAAGGDVDVDKMNAKLTVDYSNNEGLEIVDLPYEDANLVATFVVPPVGTLDSTLAADWLAGAITSGQPSTAIELQVPKFEARLRIELTKELGAMGITQAFTDDADFSKLSDEPTYLDFVQHEAWVKVAEKGTEGAAATAGGINAGAAPSEEPIVVDIDRPFIFLVREKTSNAVLFAAIVRDPSLAAK